MGRKPWTVGAKLDLSAAFTHLDLSEDTSWYCCFYAGGVAYRYTKNMWGTSYAPFWCQRVVKNIANVVEKMVNYKANIYVYMDDMAIVAVNQKDVEEARDKLLGVLSATGFTVNTEKSSLVPSREFEWLGYLATPNGLKINPKKTQKTRDMLKKLLEDPSLQNFESLIGRLAHVSRILPGLRPYVANLMRCIPQECNVNRKKKMIRVKLADKTIQAVKHATKLATTEGAGLQVHTSKQTYDTTTDAT